ncbi:MAG: DUF5777 family beta-barrel protein [Bacteroidota bacterium]
MKQLLFVFIWLTAMSASAQSLDDLMEAETEEETTDKQETTFVENHFLGTRVINLPTTELTRKGMLDFRISHRFGELKSGASDLWGIDRAQIRFNLEYGFTDNLVVGLARSSYRKTYEGYFKYRFARQQEEGFPLTLAFYGNTGVWSEEDFDFQDGLGGFGEEEYVFTDRLTYTFQLIASRKFGKNFSAQLNPSLVQFAIDTRDRDRQAYALGGGVRYKLSPRFALTSEYVYLLNRENLPLVDGQEARNSFSIGMDIETGGHNFQLHITNSIPQTAAGYIAQTTETWGDGGIRFGFNIKRSFTIVKPKAR